MRNKADKRLWTLSIVGCVIVVLTVLFVSIKVETNNVKNRIHSTIEYIKDQYSMYNSFNDAVEAKSLVRMVEKVQQTARNFKADDQALEKEHLKQDRNIKNLVEHLERLYEKPVKLSIFVEDSDVLTPMDYRKKVYQDLREQARTDLQQDKKLLLLQKEFDAKLDIESVRPV